MIVTFKTKVSGDVIYFKDIALQLLGLMGRDDKVPSALFAEDVTAALTQLQQGLAKVAEAERVKVEQAEAALMADNRNKTGKSYISLNTRAIPLLELLQKAEKKHSPVQWE